MQYILNKIMSKIQITLFKMEELATKTKFQTLIVFQQFKAMAFNNFSN